MTVFMLKLIAIITMLIDHTGAIIYTDNLIFRIIGRLSFPIFAFLIAEGYAHTRDSKKYISRVFIFAMISQIPFFLAFYLYDGSFNIYDIVNYFSGNLNVLFTFTLALFAIWSYENMNKILSAFVVFSLCLLATSLGVDYSFYGVLLVFVFYIFKSKTGKILAFFVVHFIYLCQTRGIITFVDGIPSINTLIFMNISYTLVMIMPLVSSIFIYFYNGQLGSKKLKWFFYVFYPAHILILYLIKIYLF